MSLTKPNTGSWVPEVIADSSGKWSRNSLRFATKEEAEGNVADLFNRWWLVTDTRVVESPEPPTAVWHADREGRDRLELLPVEAMNVAK